jgi:putative ABC transport system permease protein
MCVHAREAIVSWIALKMLTSNRGKYLGIIFGITFAALLMAHQVSIFCGVMGRTTSQIRDVLEADLWVMDPRVRYVEEAPGLAGGYLQRVRGVEGVAWAVPLYKGTVRARLGAGDYRQVFLMGLDDATLIGAPREMVLGTLGGLRRPDGIVLGEVGYHFLWPGEPLRLGRTLEINESRAVVVGICKNSAPYQTLPVAYTRFSQVARFAPGERNHLSFVLAKGQPGVPPEEVCRRIRERTGLQALTTAEFCGKTIGYYLRMTGLPINFGITVFLGFVVGVAIAGQTFYLFTLEHLGQFGALKAMGVSNRRLIGMILLQALVVGAIGYSLGMGLTGLFFEWTKNMVHLQCFFMPWQVMAGTAVAVLLVVVLASLLSIRRVLVLEPAIVFRG